MREGNGVRGGGGVRMLGRGGGGIGDCRERGLVGKGVRRSSGGREVGFKGEKRFQQGGAVM